MTTDNTENRCFTDTAFVKYLLPASRQHVAQKMVNFLRAHPEFMEPGGYRRFHTDPVKTTSRLFHPVEKFPNNDTLLDVSSFAHLYFQIKPQNFDLFKCGDIRKILILITRAGCFTATQANLAYNLKKIYDVFVHTELIPDSLRTQVFKDVTCLLETFENTTSERNKLQKAFEYGTQYFLRKSDRLDKENEVQKNELRYENNNVPTNISNNMVVRKALPQQNQKNEIKYQNKYLEPNWHFEREVQVKFGPVPGHLDVPTVHSTMREWFRKWGDVVNLYIPGDIIRENGRPVRYGLVVFNRQIDAQRVIKEGRFTIENNIEIRLMPFTSA